MAVCVCCGFACEFLVCFLLLWAGGGGGCFCFLFGVWGGGVEPPVTIGCRGSGKLEV